MRGSSLSYLIKQGARNIGQNRMISLAAIGVLAACLLLVGASLLFTLNVNQMVGYFESQNEVMVFLGDEVSGADLTKLDERLHSMDNILSATFISREEGLREYMAQLGDDGTLLEWLVEDNPLQNSYRLVLRDLSRLNETVEQLRKTKGIDSVSASSEVAKAVVALKNAVYRVGVFIISILAAVSLLIVANTIRITVFNRRKEIGIMKYVGATDAFIRLPFLSEGILLGLIAALVAFLLLWAGYAGLTRWIAQSEISWGQILFANLIPFGAVAPRILFYFTAGGMGIGAVGSVTSVGKYLKV